MAKRKLTPNARMSTHTFAAVTIFGLIGTTCDAQKLSLTFDSGAEEVKCPCDINPRDICICSTSHDEINKCKYLPQMNLDSMTRQFTDFLANTNTQPRGVGFVCTTPGFEQVPYPIACVRGVHAENGSFHQISVGTDKEVVLKCDGGFNAGEFCSDDAFCGRTCAADSSRSCSYYIECPSQCESDGKICNTDSDCSTGACVAPGTDACTTHRCNKYGTDYYGMHGLLRIVANEHSCSATQSYRNGCGGGHGDYLESYMVEFDANDPGPEHRACMKVIDEVCQHFEVPGWVATEVV